MASRHHGIRTSMYIRDYEQRLIISKTMNNGVKYLYGKLIIAELINTKTSSGRVDLPKLF